MMESTETPEESQERDRRALEALLVNNPQLERLDELLDKFNIFEALDAVRQERRHSDFLAYLLDPQENHGLGDTYLKRFLQKSLASANRQEMPITPLALHLMSLQKATTYRERWDIDVLVVDHLNKLIVVLENKIDSSAHSKQLRKYREAAEAQFPGFKIICLYLSSDGSKPRDEQWDDKYVSVGYSLVCEVLEDLLKGRASTIGDDVYTLIKHYQYMVRRHIVGDSEIAKLCNEIYLSHRRALDLIYEYRFDHQNEIRHHLENLIGKQEGISLDDCEKLYIRFCVNEWKVSKLMTSEGWTDSGRILLFEFRNYHDSLTLALLIGPGDEEVRRQLYKMARRLELRGRRRMTKWTVIYEKPFLIEDDYREVRAEERCEKMDQLWHEFVRKDLPRIKETVRAEQWIGIGRADAST